MKPIDLDKLTLDGKLIVLMFKGIHVGCLHLNNIVYNIFYFNHKYYEVAIRIKTDETIFVSKIQNDQVFEKYLDDLDFEILY